MRKQLLSLISCVLMGTAAQAQNTIFFEGFENPVMESYPNWTATERDGNTSMHNKWHSVQKYTTNTTGFTGQYVAASFAGEPTTSIDHLFRSPAISLPPGNTTLSFKVATETSAGEKYTVYILPASSSFQGTEVPILTETISNQSAVTKSINIPSNYAGQQIRLYFRHYQQGNIFLYLDDVAVTTGAVLAVSEYSKSDKNINVYPNPVKNQLTIQSSEKIVSTEVFDVAGRAVQAKINENKNVDMSSLQSGNYLIKIGTKEGITTKKITKE